MVCMHLGRGEACPPTLMEPGLSLPGVGQAWTLCAPLGATDSNQDPQPPEALEEWDFQNLEKLLGDWEFLWSFGEWTLALMVALGGEQRRGEEPHSLEGLNGVDQPHLF